MGRKTLLIISAVFLSSVLTSCSSKMSYRFLDWIIEWQVDDYVQWNRSQQKDFDQRLEKLLDWHQRTQLSQYSQLLKKLQADLQQPLQEPVIEEHLDQIGMFWSDLMGRTSPDAAALLTTLDSEQVEELIENLNSEINKDEKKYKKQSLDEFEEKRLDRLEKFSKRWIGALDDKQQQLAEQWNQQHQNTWPLWLENRKEWVKAFQQLMQSRNEPEFEQKIKQLFAHSRDLWSPEYRELVKSNTANTMSFILQLHPTLSPEQQQHLDGELSQWVTMFDELAKEAEAG
jgi:truncated hemoglobin YjbI